VKKKKKNYKPSQNFKYQKDDTWRKFHTEAPQIFWCHQKKCSHNSNLVHGICASLF
jgi:hypothetical protein